MDRPGPRLYTVLILGSLGASRCLPQSVVRYAAAASTMKPFFTSACLLVLAFSTAVLAQTTMPAAPATRTTIQIGADGFPVGHDSPEGAASDLARAFIKCDGRLFDKTCVRLYANGGTGPAAYAKFLRDTAEAMKVAKTSAHPGGPKAIGKVFAARHLSHDGPASYGYAAFGFQDIMFVDVGVFLRDGGHALNRTMVIKDKDGLWYVHPMPDASPLLSDGLNDEGPSTQDFSEAYIVHK